MVTQADSLCRVLAYFEGSRATVKYFRHDATEDRNIYVTIGMQELRITPDGEIQKKEWNTWDRRKNG